MRKKDLCVFLKHAERICVYSFNKQKGYKNNLLIHIFLSWYSLSTPKSF